MKKLITIPILIISLGFSYADRPEEIPSKLSELKTKSWYLEKFRSWQTYLEANPADEQGWLQLFRAARYGGVSDQELEPLAMKIATDFPESSSAMYVKSKMLGWNREGVTLLSKAIEASGDKNVFMEDRLILEEYKLSDQRTALSSRVFESGLVNSSTLNYGYNVLMSVGEDGVLYTDATHTTIPLWILQDVMSVRPDVLIINLELAEDPDYLVRKLDGDGLEKAQTASAIDLPYFNPDRDFYYALTLPRNDLKKIEDQLFVVGLASQYGSERLDHYRSLRENIENKFLLDYLTIDFNGEPNTALGNVLRTNYIVPFLLLKEYYDELGNKEMSEFWKEKLIGVADKSELRARVELLLKKQSEERRSFKKVDLDMKELDKKWKKIKDNVYASNVELSNKEYEFFLDYLKDNGYDDLHDQAKIDLSGYEGISYSFHKNYHSSKFINPRNKGTFDDYPAMDIPFEGAKIYYEWLTAQYNVQENRKFQKVKFRLPSQNEWTMAALGYADFQSWVFEENTMLVKERPKDKGELVKLSEYKVSYPWATHAWSLRNSITNIKKCYLANIKAPEGISCPAGIQGDGFEITSPVATYFANQLGLYDVIGNVAEMTDVNGIAMGGSWNHPAEQSTITSVINYSGPDTAVGFRLFMEVIEE